MLMVGNPPKGRPALPGPRNASGRRKIDPRGAAVWYRIRDEGKRFALDERLATEPSRLFWLGELNDAQVETAFLVGKIYGVSSAPRKTAIICLAVLHAGLWITGS